MSEAYKCDRCNAYTDEEPEIIHHQESRNDNSWKKHLCHKCYHGFIEYLVGMDSETANKVAPDRD